jgi:hypothetical protein
LDSATTVSPLSLGKAVSPCSELPPVRKVSSLARDLYEYEPWVIVAE